MAQAALSDLKPNGSKNRGGMLVRPIECQSDMPAGCWGSGEGRNATR
jgi:hypothetical protein